ncbi:hypothetical protein CVT24_002007 [Panaeolus cyanescens]|uniref:DUF6534 domain-containing protein n=1 Tax=Panaeolus cyanescens TaxID=181874 RepID=A0A409YHI5_9AGAR|nr:hypothetical protein CVT24_002007 [Panaeolus cyanescens]
MLSHMVWSILLEVLFNLSGTARLEMSATHSIPLSNFKLTPPTSLVSNNNIPLTVVVSTFILAGFGCSVAFTAHSMKLTTWVELEGLKGLSMAVNLLGAAADVLITAALLFFLHRSRTGFKKSDTMISTLAISTGLLTSICAVASLISILASGHTLIYVAFYFCLGRLYSNSVLATLNARQSIRGLGEHSDELSFSLQSTTKTASGARNISSTVRPLEL